MTLDETSAWTFAVIDDDPHARELVSYALKTSYPGCQIVCVERGETMLNADALDQITAVITDSTAGGADFIRRLRASRFLGPVLMLSNSDEKEAEARAAGADEFLSFERWAEAPARLATLILGR